MTSYFEILADPDATKRWFLKTPLANDGKEIDPRNFTAATYYRGTLPAVLPIRRDGHHVNFNLADFDMIVVPQWLNERLEKRLLGQIQRIPVSVEGETEPFEILNILDKVRCIDDVKSEYLRWSEEDGRPEKIGQFRMITRLVIDPERAQGHKFFRLDGWQIALIVDEEIKSILEESNSTGVVFKPVA